MKLFDLIIISGATLSHANHKILDNISLAIKNNDRIGLIGRNGSGKSSFLDMIDGKHLIDNGSISKKANIKISYVEQEPILQEDINIFKAIYNDMSSDYQHYDNNKVARTKKIINDLNLDENLLIKNISKGVYKKVALAKAIVSDPDLLMLDEPTNHLDIEGIEYFADKLSKWKKSLILVTHDRYFLDKTTNKIIEIDKNKIFYFPGNYSKWQSHKDQIIESEETLEKKLDEVLHQEELWIRKGVQARRKRNEGRVRRLEQLRQQREERIKNTGTLKITFNESKISGKIVYKVKSVSKSYNNIKIIDNFSTEIIRKDRVGIVGPNSVGKTTLLNIILQKDHPDSGSVETGTNINVGYFDQQKNSLYEDKTILENISINGEWIFYDNKNIHVIKYLENFLFHPSKIHNLVKTLSGGEKTRLALAMLLSKPTNVLILDEPTNDLDIESVEVLEEKLQNYHGTIIIVSHDRTFLNNIVTQTIVFKGNGNWINTFGTIDTNEYFYYKKQEKINKNILINKNPEKKSGNKVSKLQPWEVKELEEITKTITTLENKLYELTAKLSTPQMHQKPNPELEEINIKIETISLAIEEKYLRWETLEEKNNKHNNT
ncbi:ABC-F family ATP-binding cassette domain-containing protein [Candidatus Kinetoplastidibacterium crithidiae]|uniref:Elongation factor 3-like ATPase n=1 Tax=Candidatus Kinetoplastidibacterium crithidiae TCC036E TaxID=1208918 RepID=M1L5E3_9PROT|nr:ATP-binding cassette domain-containing protein [Candidatus Kinetoplastibacterium crithidii]AFZ82481.1 ABC transporter ATP-binding protein [Candidatus Kinetoplastibacterium crithidii (ex Angomonas deanei ATCC 30255)]AGF47858.1 Elongation factor 3-like ATPase [Candidatus Kinetoplastibacterium crithidii TCC036E]